METATVTAWERDRVMGRLAERLAADGPAVSEVLEQCLWDAVVLFQGFSFKTAKGLEFTYTVRGNEIFVSRKEKSITRSTVDIAFQRARELGEMATGPKKLGVFGASYIFPVFVQLGVIGGK